MRYWESISKPTVPNPLLVDSNSTHMKPDCIFCQVIEGKLPSYKIYEDEFTYVLLDIHPVNRGHALVIPKNHYENIFDTPSATFQRVMDTVHILAPKIKESLGAEAINIGINNDKAAGQIIYHLHVHIIPRWKNDGHSQWSENPYREGEIKEIQRSILRELAP